MTALPVPSKDPRDLLFNAQKLDEAVTGTSPTFVDRLGQPRMTLAGALEVMRAVNMRGAWATATAYAVNDLYTSSGVTYRTVVAHTSTSVAADLAAGRVVVHQGALSSDLPTVVTSSFSTFALALAAAANKTLVINSAVSLAANTTIPATTGVEVAQQGSIALAGFDLTINGDFTAGARQVFTGLGNVNFGTSSRSVALSTWRDGVKTAVYATSRLVTQTDADTTGPVHMLEDNSTLQMTHTMAANYNAYASLDAAPNITGPGHYDHYVGAQVRPTYSGSGSIWSRMDGFNFLATHTGTGPIAIMRGIHVENPLGTGTINALYGLFVQRLNRGAENHGIFSATPLNTVRVGGGEVAAWMLQGNGQTGGFGLSIQSRADSSAHVLQTGNFPLLLGTNNAYKAALSAAGLFKMSDVGVTDILSSNQRLEVAGVGGATFKATGGATVGAVLTWNASTTGDSLFNAFYTETSATLRGSIDYNRAGNLLRVNTTSDQTLKNDLGPADVQKAVDRMLSVVLHQAAWKDDPTQKSQLMVFAQELHKVMPGAVSVGGEYEETFEEITEQRLVSEAVPASLMLGEDGKPLTPEREAIYETVVVQEGRTEKRYRPWAVDKTAFVLHLLACFQYQHGQIADLTERIAALEGGRP